MLIICIYIVIWLHRWQDFAGDGRHQEMPLAEKKMKRNIKKQKKIGRMDPVTLSDWIHYPQALSIFIHTLWR
ncbi:hypothetical protein C0073_021470 [Aeromonas veronii]|nr:hypothetical protein C0073_021470 [Aeromonas veronii]